jgi:hypothetical protein
MIAHIAKRIAVVSMGYLAALAASTALLWSLAFIAAQLWPQLWVKKSPSGLPPEIEVLIVILVVSIAFSVLPAAVFVVATEVFAWRHLRVHLLGAFLIASLIVLMTLGWPAYVSTFDWVVAGIAIVSALLAGFVYWFISGRHAGRLVSDS